MDNLSKMQVLTLWSLLGHGGSAYQSAIKPNVKKTDREVLLQAGLIATEKHQNKIWIEVTDKGWCWASEHLDADLPLGSTAGSIILQQWLAYLKSFLKIKNIPLSEVIASNMKPPQPSLQERVRQAYLKLTDGVFNEGVFLYALRNELYDVSRQALDECLLQLFSQEGYVLTGLENPMEITPEVEQSSVISAGRAKYLLWVTQ